MKLTDLPPSHVVRTTDFKVLRTLYPQIQTPNDLLRVEFSPARLPPRESTIEGLFHELTTKHPLRNTPFKDLRIQSWNPLTQKWTTLRAKDARNQYTYNTLPALQYFRYVWRVVL